VGQPVDNTGSSKRAKHSIGGTGRKNNQTDRKEEPKKTFREDGQATKLQTKEKKSQHRNKKKDQNNKIPAKGGSTLIVKKKSP